MPHDDSTPTRLGWRISDLLALVFTLKRTRRCPQGCGVVIRFRFVSDAEAKRLTAVANDHTGRHQWRPVGEAR